ncbi:MAG: CAP domain-containing protein, partial [Thermoleophilaceae bacterium]
RVADLDECTWRARSHARTMGRSSRMNALSLRFLAVLAASCAFVLGGAAQASAACLNEDAIPTAENIEAIRTAFICLHNEEREKASAAVLRADSRLLTAAQKHAEDMVADGYFGHDTPDGINPFDRMRREGYLGRGFVWNAGETIAWASGSRATPRSVMDSWLDSTSQRLTLLAPDFRHIGVGIALGAPVERDPGASPAVTYTIDYGWRTSVRAMRRCLRRAENNRLASVRRVMRAKCHGLANPREFAL